MRKIKIKTWKAKLPIKDEKGNVVDSKEVDEDLLVALNNLIASKRPEELPRGIEKFKVFGKLATAFEEADKTGTLKLEEREYGFLHDIVEKDIPASWGFNPNISKAIDDFLNAKDEED